uniref:YtfJ family protein n=1 Tax=Thaumasiovibrio occultus TaxID=1891184 RepID=UPI000B362395|nr:YtfJ family protein [Thaumasiovibrio occultus]
MKLKAIFASAALFLAAPSFAHNLVVGQSLPAASVANKGEIVINNGALRYQSWSTSQLNGKVRVIHAIAGRSAAKEMNEPLMTAITAAELPASRYQTTTIINQNDAIWGTGGFVQSSAEESKQEFHWSSMVLDAEGKVAATWDLKPESSAIIVIDQNGKVLYVKEGALSNAEMNNVLALIQQNIF